MSSEDSVYQMLLHIDRSWYKSNLYYICDSK